jgi:hypothetical protein
MPRHWQTSKCLIENWMAVLSEHFAECSEPRVLTELSGPGSVLGTCTRLWRIAGPRCPAAAVDLTLHDAYPLGILMGMRLPRSVRERFLAYGRAGGRARAERMSPQAQRTVARRAAVQRWIRVRFGAPSFEILGLPGGKIIDTGLAALAADQETTESLLVCLAAPRLRREGVPLPCNLWPDADLRLYRRLERTDEDLAHARYLAYLRQAASFADACAQTRVA